MLISLTDATVEPGSYLLRLQGHVYYSNVLQTQASLWDSSILRTIVILFLIFKSKITSVLNSYYKLDNSSFISDITQQYF